MKLYDIVKKILIEYPATRGNDKALIWVVFGTLGYIDNKTITRDGFFKAPSLESITRARRKVQELYPELQANKKIREFRKEIQDQKGTHIYRVNTANYNNDQVHEMEEILAL